MADVFVSYARSDKARVAPLVAAIEAQGWSVWWDPAIDAGQQFDDQIEAELKAAKAVLVVWTPTSAASRWVRGEAREAADRGTLVPVRFDGASLPMDVRAIHTTELDGWDEDTTSPQFQSLLRALTAMIARHGAARAGQRDRESRPTDRGDSLAPRDLRAAVREHEWRCRAGVFQRRHQRGHHHRPEQGLGTGGGFPQQCLPVQGHEGRRAARSRAN